MRLDMSTGGGKLHLGTDGGTVTLRPYLGQGPEGPEGPEGPAGPSGGPIPAGGTPGDVPTPKAGGGYEWLDLSAQFVQFVDQNGEPLPVGSVTTIHVNTVTGEIDDITFEEA